MSFKDVDTKLTEPELDREKDRALLRMKTARNATIWHADVTANRLYHTAHEGILKCRTEVEVSRIEEAFKAVMVSMKALIDPPAPAPANASGGSDG